MGCGRPARECLAQRMDLGLGAEGASVGGGMAVLLHKLIRGQQHVQTMSQHVSFTTGQGGRGL